MYPDVAGCTRRGVSKALGFRRGARGQKGHAPGWCGNRQARTRAPREKGGEIGSFAKGYNPSLAGDFTLLPTNHTRLPNKHSAWHAPAIRLGASPSPRPSPLGRGRIIVSLSTIPESHIGRRRVRGPGLQGDTPRFVGSKNRLLAGWGLRPGTGALRGLGNRDRWLTGRAADAVVMTFIMGEFNRGPWTSAVQGEKFLKYFLRQARGRTKRI